MNNKPIKLTAIIITTIFLTNTMVWAAPGGKSIFNPTKDISARFTIHNSPFTSLYIPEKYERINESPADLLPTGKSNRSLVPMLSEQNREDKPREQAAGTS